MAFTVVFSNFKRRAYGQMDGYTVHESGALQIEMVREGRGFTHWVAPTGWIELVSSTGSSPGNEHIDKHLAAEATPSN